MKIPKKKWIQCVAGLLLSFVLLLSPSLPIPGLDQRADEYFTKAISQAGVAYATCRVMNGAISVLKDTQLQAEPAGVGLSIAIGQVLDPIDDMIERTSDVLVTSITSLGVQKLIFEISASIIPELLGILLFLFSIMLLFSNERVKGVQFYLAKIMILLLIARLCLPISSLANSYLNDDYFEPEISLAKQELALGSAEMDKLTEFTLPEIDGFKGTIENSASFIKLKSIEFKEAFVSLITNAGSIVDNLLKLTFLYIGLFLVQVILLPLLMFWLMAKTANTLFATRIPMIIQTSKKKESNK